MSCPIGTYGMFHGCTWDIPRDSMKLTKNEYPPERHVRWLHRAFWWRFKKYTGTWSQPIRPIIRGKGSTYFLQPACAFRSSHFWNGVVEIEEIVENISVDRERTESAGRSKMCEAAHYYFTNIRSTRNVARCAICDDGGGFKMFIGKSISALDQSTTVALVYYRSRREEAIRAFFVNKMPRTLTWFNVVKQTQNIVRECRAVI